MHLREPMIAEQEGAPADAAHVRRADGADLLPGEATPGVDGITWSRGVPEQDESVIATQLDRYLRGRDAMRDWAQTYKTTADFLEGRQWSEADRKEMEEAGRPVVTLNKMAPLFRFITGHFRQNRYEVRYLPAQDGDGTQAQAEAMTQVAKSVDENNNSIWNDAEVFQDGILGGRGLLDYRMDFSRNDQGEIREAVLDPASSVIDPEAHSYDPEGWGWFQYSKWVSAQDIEALYGTAARDLVREQGVFGSHPVSGRAAEADDDVSPRRYFGQEADFERSLSYYGSGGAPETSDYIHARRKLIRLLECQHRMFRRGRYFVDLETGDKSKVPDNFEREQIHRILMWAQSQNQPLDVIETTEKEIRWTVTAGDRLIYDDWSPYRSLTVVPFFAYFRRGVTRGLFEDLIDPSREINKRRSVMLHIISTMANSGWIWQKGALDPDMVDRLENEGGRPGLGIEYNEGSPEPKRIEPGVPPTSYERAERAATEDLKEISGVNDSALGMKEGESHSGRAIMARQKQAVVGLEPVFDNFSRSRNLKGRKIMELVQDFYTETRLVRTLGDNGDMLKTWINVALPSGEILNNVTAGKYRVAVDEAPASATFQQAQFEAGMDLLKAGIPIPPDAMIDMAPIPRKDEIKARMQQKAEAEAAAAAAMPPGAVPPAGPAGPPPAGPGGPPPGPPPAPPVPPQGPPR